MSVPEGYVKESAVAQSCEACDAYSFKIVWLGDEPTEGKCFVDKTDMNKVHWVSSLGWCPRYRHADSTASSSAE